MRQDYTSIPNSDGSRGAGAREHKVGGGQSNSSSSSSASSAACYQNPAVAPPAAFMCCITSELMNDPVITSDGQSYERAAIERWLRGRHTSPRTNERLQSKRLIPNIALRQQIADFRNEHGYSPPRPYHPPPLRHGGASSLDSQGGSDDIDACPSVPGWAVAAAFLAVWLTAWAAGEITVAKEVMEAFQDGNLSFATLFTVVWLGAWSFGGCIACSAMYGLCCRECFPGDSGGTYREAHREQQPRVATALTQPLPGGIPTHAASHLQQSSDALAV